MVTLPSAGTGQSGSLAAHAHRALRAPGPPRAADRIWSDGRTATDGGTGRRDGTACRRTAGAQAGTEECGEFLTSAIDQEEISGQTGSDQ